MAWSLAFTASGLIIAYLLLKIEAPKEGETQTMNSLLASTSPGPPACRAGAARPSFWQRS